LELTFSGREILKETLSGSPPKKADRHFYGSVLLTPTYPQLSCFLGVITGGISEGKRELPILTKVFIYSNCGAQIRKKYGEKVQW
jgi:hypothetical protein